MSIDAAVAFFRAQERQLFRSTCTVTRSGVGEPVFDPETNAYTDPPATTVYSGACMVKRTARDGNDVQAGETEVRLQDLVVKLPADTAARVDDIVTVSASPDADVVGRTFRITDVLSTDWQVSRECAVEEVV